jgi:hypothetical protein
MFGGCGDLRCTLVRRDRSDSAISDHTVREVYADISLEHARLKDHIATMDGGLEAKIHEGLVDLVLCWVASISHPPPHFLYTVSRSLHMPAHLSYRHITYIPHALCPLNYPYSVSPIPSNNLRPRLTIGPYFPINPIQSLTSPLHQIAVSPDDTIIPSHVR